MSQMTFDLLNNSRSRPPVANSILPTNLTTWKHPIHRWYNFIAGYSPEFVQNCIHDSNLIPEDIVLDPFAGCGTTLVVSAAAGLSAVGYEPHPFFFKIAQAKTEVHLKPSTIHAIGKILHTGSFVTASEDFISKDARAFLEKLFAPDILSALLGARISLEASPFADSPIAFLMLSRLVDECSFAQTDGIYKAPSSRKRAIPVHEAISKIVEAISKDLDPDLKVQNATVHNAAAQNMSELRDNSVGLVVTSPPYLNNFDFAEMTRMHLYFWGMAKNWGDITQTVRRALIVNTTTALNGHREGQDAHDALIENEVCKEINSLIPALAAVKKVKAGKKDYDLLLKPYMSQITTIYRECFRAMRPGAVAHTMIADAAFYGVHVPSPQWLAKTLSWIGFSNVQCNLVRTRGHRWVLTKRAGSPIGLGEYHIIARK